jgi:hypothetical protein
MEQHLDGHPVGEVTYKGGDQRNRNQPNTHMCW